MNSFNAQPVEDLLQEAQGKWTGYITSHEECIDMRTKLNSARLVSIDEGENIVDDYPHSPEAKIVHTYQLWEAMVDYSDYIEAKDNKNHFQVDRLKAMSEVEMEVLAWELLKATENAHLGTLGFTVTCDSAERKRTWRYSQFGSFGARFEKVKEACRTSKSIVYNLTTSSFILKLTADPVHELNSKKDNKVINDRRAAIKKSANTGQAQVAPIATVAPVAPVAPVAQAPALDEASLQPARAAPSARGPPQVTRRVQAGRVAKTKQRGNSLSQNTVAGLESTLPPQATGLSLPRATRASRQGNRQPLPSAVAGPGPTNILVEPAPGLSGQAAMGQGGQRAYTLEEILQIPMNDAERDKPYRDTVKDLLRGMGEARRRGQ